MANAEELLECFNRGCGQRFNPNNNSDDSCRHHPGPPFFHDAYKGWSCCNKKSTDFTEFLNIKGCTFGNHSNIKPPEPEKSSVQQKDEKEIEVAAIKPLVQPTIQRPPIDTPMTTIKAELTPSVTQKIHQTTVASENAVAMDDPDNVPIGTICKNSGCRASFEGADSDNSACVYHSGVPIFHEGMKYWSCCQKKTPDFNTFLSQVGCETGKHKWTTESTDKTTVDCRWDWHQTGSHVVVSIYSKDYCPTTSIVQLNPIRVFANLVFPNQANATFTLDVELQRVIDVKASQVTMYGTKVEMKLKKAEPGSWTKLEITESKPQSNWAIRKTIDIINSIDLHDL